MRVLFVVLFFGSLIWELFLGSPCCLVLSRSLIKEGGAGRETGDRGLGAAGQTKGINI